MKKPKQIDFGRVRLSPESLGATLRTRREALGLSLRELADQAGVASSTIHSVEQGNYHVQLDRFLLILAALDLTPGEVMTIDDTKPPPPATPRERAVAELLGSKTDTSVLLRRLADLLEEEP